MTCDYWRHGRRDVTLESVKRLLPELESLGTRTVLLSGGEPLLNPEWPQIAALLRTAGRQLWLLTSGLSLAKHAQRAAPAVRVDHRVAGRHLRCHLCGHPRPRRIRQGLRGYPCRGRRRCDGRIARDTAARQLPRTAALRDPGARARREPGFLPGRGRQQSARLRAARRFHARAGAARRTTSPNSTRLLDGARAASTRRTSATRFIAESPAKLRRPARLFRRPVRPGAISAGALQCARVFRGRGGRRARVAVLLHSRTCGARGQHVARARRCTVSDPWSSCAARSAPANAPNAERCVCSM